MFQPIMINKNDTSSLVCSNYILIFREWKRSIDRLTKKILLDGLMIG